MLLFMFIFDNCNIMQEMWVLIFDCQLSLYSTAQVEIFSSISTLQSLYLLRAFNIHNKKLYTI